MRRKAMPLWKLDQSWLRFWYRLQPTAASNFSNALWHTMTMTSSVVEAHPRGSKQGSQEQVPRNRCPYKVPKNRFTSKVPKHVPKQGSQEEVPKQGSQQRVPRNRFPNKFPRTGSQVRFPEKVPRQCFQEKVPKQGSQEQLLKQGC